MERRIAVIGLGYVGLPVAAAFAEAGFKVFGFDIDRTRIAELKQGRDRTSEVDLEALALPKLSFHTDAEALKGADFYIVTTPTPVDKSQRPDLTALTAACESVGGALAAGDVVVIESTVYPGATEETCVPVLEAASGLRVGRDFFVGYSPERINPGDQAHGLSAVVKVVSANDEATLATVSQVYGRIAKAGLHPLMSIRAAEAAKLVENIQRDINIALVNELAMICHRMEIDTGEVLAAAGTKWNFLPFTPGLVGGHCIGIDPYYLIHKTAELGYHPDVVLSGRRVNDRMGEFIAQECLRLLFNTRPGRRPRVTILGYAFKENVPDVRNSKVADIVDTLRRYDVEVQLHDPVVAESDPRIAAQLGLLPREQLQPADAVVLAVAHAPFAQAGWPLIVACLSDAAGPVLDVKSVLDRQSVPPNVTLWRL